MYVINDGAFGVVACNVCACGLVFLFALFIHKCVRFEIVLAVLTYVCSCDPRTCLCLQCEVHTVHIVLLK